MTARPEMEAVGTGGRLASDMCIEQWKKNSTCTKYASRTIYLGCVSLSPRSVPVLVKVHAQLACIANVRPPGRLDSDLLRLDGCCTEASFSQEERGFFFLRPYFERTKAVARRPGTVPMLPSESACTTPMRCLLQLRCTCRAIAGDRAPAAGDALFRQLARSCNQQDGCGFPPHPLEGRVCDMSDMAPARLDFG